MSAADAESEPKVKQPKLVANEKEGALNGDSNNGVVKSVSVKPPEDADDDDEPVVKPGSRKLEHATRNCPYLGTIDRFVCLWFF